MERYVMRGGTLIRGEVVIGGAKECSICGLGCCVMTDEKSDN